MDSFGTRIIHFSSGLILNSVTGLIYIAHKMKFFINDFFSKCDQICSFLRIWSHLLKKSLIENLFLCSVNERPLTDTV